MKAWLRLGSGLVAGAIVLAVSAHSVAAAEDGAPAPQPEKTEAPKTDAAKTDATKTDASADKPAAEPPAAEAAPSEKKEEPPAWENAPFDRRGGFAVGINLGIGVGASNGFPADSKKIGLERYYTESGLGFATSSTLWIGGGFDWLTFGIGGSYSIIVNGETTSPAPILLFHLDIYPLYPFGGMLADLGLMADFGLGFPTTTDNETDETLIDGTSGSHLSVGVFWDGIKAWKIHMGPYVAGHYMWSDSIRRPAAIAGFRMALFALP
ncbi:MAG: hypothetical protein U0271_29775 [Polyangiaceae bacterium]